MPLQGYWADQKAPVFRDLPDDLIAVLPIGAVEQHGPHLPLSVDRDLVQATIRRTLPLLQPDQNVLVLPVLSITKSEEHNRHPGTLSLSTETLLAQLRDIAASIARAGVKRVVLLNGHGGNAALLEIAARDMRIAHEMIVVSCFWSGFADAAEIFDAASYATDLHAGESETSAMLATHPELVDMAQAMNFAPALTNDGAHSRFIGLTGQPARPGWIIDDLHPDGACGNAAAATAAKGTQLMESAARNFAVFLKDFASFDHRAAR